MVNKGVRIYDLARRLAVPARDLIDLLQQNGIEATSHMSTIDGRMADLILDKFGAKRLGEKKPEPIPSEKKVEVKRPEPIPPEKKVEVKKPEPIRPEKKVEPQIPPVQKAKKPVEREVIPAQPKRLYQPEDLDQGKKREKFYEKPEKKAPPREPARMVVKEKGRERAPERKKGLPPPHAPHISLPAEERDWDEVETLIPKKAGKILPKLHEKFDEEVGRLPVKKREVPARAKVVLPTPIKKPRKRVVEKIVAIPKPEKPSPPKVEEAPLPKRIKIPEAITVKELADKMNIPPAKVIRHLMTMGLMANVNQPLEPEAAISIAKSFEFEVATIPVEAETVLQEEKVDASKLKPRPPVVTIMGHVDHGKTTLLDAIRESKVVDTEFGGITQHIGAYSVEIRGQRIIFLDTPGHEAFTAMRARGAQVTDEVVLVVAADDGVMPQTIEAIDHAKAAKVPIIVAINKIDMPGANPDRVMQELTKYDLTPEAWGGETICVKVSAKTRSHLDDLLEMILLQAEMLELKADPDRPAKGVVVEALLDKGRGPVATVLVQSGTLRIGDPCVVGVHYGRVRAMLDDRGRRLDIAGPATPVEVLGLTGVPVAGDTFVVVDSERKARHIAESRQEQQQKTEFLRTPKITLEELHHHIQEGGIQELRIVIKADVHGSVEALTDALERLSTEKVRLQVIHGGVGAINESDVMLASASNAIVLGFNVRPVTKAREMAEKEQVDVRLYNIIYQAIDDVKKAMEGLLAPTYKEVLQGQALVQAVFTVSKVGTVAGCRVSNGKITRNSIVRVVRDHQEVFKGNIASLRRVKDDVREVLTGYECGIRLEGFDDVKEGDNIEAYMLEKVAMTLESASAKHD
jgi:translation initiation factor IF-2